MQKYQLRWSGVDWAFAPAATKASLRAEVDRLLKPDENITKALDAFKVRFYPDDLIPSTRALSRDFRARLRAEGIKLGAVDLNEKQKAAVFAADPIHLNAGAPWKAHEAAYAVYRRAGRQDLLHESLARRLQSEWPLSWHWKALLPAIREWEESDQWEYIVQVSQIRRWELLLVYQVEKAVLKEGRLCELPLAKKRLLRPPQFGASHRLLRWDFYRLLFSDEVKAQLTDAFAALPQRLADSAATSLDVAYLLGRHDSFYRIQGIKQAKKKSVVSLETKVSSEMDLFPQRRVVANEEHYPPGAVEFPYDMVNLPSFDTKGGDRVLLSSDNYCKALDQLTEVLNDPTVKTVLIIAPPGSGKERLARFAYNCRKTQEDRGTFAATTVAGLKAGELAKLLFSMKRTLQVDLGKYKPQVGDGLVFRALGGALFLDEVDKAQEEVRDLLLRFLESDEVTVPDTGLVFRLSATQRPLYIFAGSKTRKEMFETVPVDFWSRISHVVEMAHPLSLGDPGEVQRATADYARMFWCYHSSNYFKRSGLTSATKSGLYEVFGDYYERLFEFSMSDAVLSLASETIADQLIQHGRAIPSIRTIRVSVGRAFFLFVDYLLHPRNSEKAIELLKLYLGHELDGRPPDEWFRELGGAISKELEADARDAEEREVVSQLRTELKRSLRQGAAAGG